MKVMKIAQVPAPAVPLTAKVQEALPLMASERGCAIAIVDGGRLAGTLSKEEVLGRVVMKGLDPRQTPVSQVMSPPGPTVLTDSGTDEALQTMLTKRRCYLPVVDQQGLLQGWLAICQLFQDHVEDLNRELDSLQAYMAADGPGG